MFSETFSTLKGVVIGFVVSVSVAQTPVVSWFQTSGEFANADVVDLSEALDGFTFASAQTAPEAPVTYAPLTVSQVQTVVFEDYTKYAQSLPNAELHDALESRLDTIKQAARRADGAVPQDVADSLEGYARAVKIELDRRNQTTEPERRAFADTLALLKQG